MTGNSLQLNGVDVNSDEPRSHHRDFRVVVLAFVLNREKGRNGEQEFPGREQYCSRLGMT